MTGEDSTTPLARQLSLTRGMRIWFSRVPDSLVAAIDPTGLELELLAAPSDGIDAALVFVGSRDELEKDLGALRQLLQPAGFVWIAWDGADEEAIRAAALPLDFIEADRCAIDGRPGLKLVLTKEHRG